MQEQDLWARLFYSVKSFELVIIGGFVKIEKQPAHSRVFKHELAGKIIFTGRFMGLQSGSCNIYYRKFR